MVLKLLENTMFSQHFHSVYLEQQVLSFFQMMYTCKLIIITLCTAGKVNMMIFCFVYLQDCAPLAGPTSRRETIPWTGSGESIFKFPLKRQSHGTFDLQVYLHQTCFPGPIKKHPKTISFFCVFQRGIRRKVELYHSLQHHVARLRGVGYTLCIMSGLAR